MAAASLNKRIVRDPGGITNGGWTAMTTMLKFIPKISNMVFAGCLIIALFPLRASALEKQIANSLGMNFVLIPPGTFMMGSPADDQRAKWNEVQHEVTIRKPFYMQTTEVTVQQWRTLMGTRVFFKKKGTDPMPVTDVSWEDCMEFIEKLNDRHEGTYRLPTEAEWEYACRGGKTWVYGWGDTIDCPKAMYANNTLKSADCVKWVRTQGLPPDAPAPVASYEPNAWGLYDMAGNVWEWCQDRYGPYPKEAVSDPQGPSSGVERVRRGGSWYGPGQRCRCANRNFSHPANRYQTTGFRLVREAE